MQDEPKNVKKGSSVPQYVWYGGLLLAGGVAALTLAILYNNKNEELARLKAQMTGKELLYLHEKDSLTDILKLNNDKYIFLAADNKNLSDNLVREQARSNRLASANAAFNTREQQYKNSFNSLQNASTKSNAEKKELEDQANLLRSQVKYLQGLLDERDRQISDLQNLIDQQHIQVQSISEEMTTLKDSIKSEDVAGYFNNTELTGAYGLADISVPFSNYFAGFSTINGYVINKHFLTGIGVGLYFYNSGWMAPVYLDFRYKFNERNFTPYIFADGGFQIDFKNFKLPSSLFMNPGVGFYHNFNDNIALNVGAGLFVEKYNIRSSFINLKVGVTFTGKGKK